MSKKSKSNKKKNDNNNNNNKKDDNQTVTTTTTTTAIIEEEKKDEKIDTLIEKTESLTINENENENDINNNNNNNNNIVQSIWKDNEGEEIMADFEFVNYQGEHQLKDIMDLVGEDLSEPYSIFTYRYFLNNWPHLCFIANHNNELAAVCISKLDRHQSSSSSSYRGYIAMLAVKTQFRKKGLGSQLVIRTINAMRRNNADEVILEAEVTNNGALNLYENLGFMRDKRLNRYYLSGVDAFRLKLLLK
jgi:N-alpha-acetyltransferase 30